MSPRRPSRGRRQDVVRDAGGDVPEDLKTRVAWLYHMEDLTQDEVASRLGLSRSRVLRILAAARRDGTVQVRVTTRLSHCVELEQGLEAAYGLTEAIVVPATADKARERELIGLEVGSYLSRHIRADMTLGLGWGITLSAAVPTIEPRKPDGIRVLSLLGGLTRVSAQNPSEFAWRVASRLGAECYMMAGPVFAPDARTRDALAAHAGIRDIFRAAQALDMAVISVGDISPDSLFREYGLLSNADLASLEAAGAVGDILCHFVDMNGEVLDHPVNRRVLALGLDGLAQARRLVLASGGWRKYPVIRAALLRLHPHVLIVDEVVAERLVAEPPAG